MASARRPTAHRRHRCNDSGEWRELVAGGPAEVLRAKVRPRLQRCEGIHADEGAARAAYAAHAKAFTVGQRIVFGTGRFAPGTTEGRRLLAHELTHVVQQSAPERRRAKASLPYGHERAARWRSCATSSARRRSRPEVQAILPRGSPAATSTSGDASSTTGVRRASASGTCTSTPSRARRATP